MKNKPEGPPFMVFRYGENGGYFYGDGAPEHLRGQPMPWMTNKNKKIKKIRHPNDNCPGYLYRIIGETDETVTVGWSTRGGLNWNEATWKWSEVEVVWVDEEEK